jgi:CheY-specific phosphatase CheX
MGAASVKPVDPTTLKPAQSQAAFVAAFVKATVEALGVQCGMKVVAGAPVAKNKWEEEGAEVIVCGGMIGKGIDFSVAFCFSEAACTQLVGGMLQKKVQLETEQLMAAASEIVRIIVFQAIKQLNERGFKFEAHFPRLVLDGKKVQIWADKMKEGVVVPFETPSRNRFTIEIL